MKLNKILFFGNERLATGLSTTAPTLRALIAAGYDITGVVVAQKQIGKSRNARDLEIVQVATAHDIPVFSPDKLTDFADELRAMQADAAVLAAYGKIVPQSIIDLFPRGIINIHPSMLPKHRGSIPIESVILNGETETGVSIMQLVAKMDAGPVYKQQQVSVSKNVSKQVLADQLQQLGAELLIENLPAILDGSLQPIPQDDSAATYDERITKEQSQLDFSKTAEQLEREVRAYAVWPRSRTTLGAIECIITSAHVEPGEGTSGELWRDAQQIGVYCSQDILVVDTLLPAGKKEMPASSFIAGYQI
ncbi:MAG: methionyl-tRNA formyltransferase [Candidatus Saccharimonadales bacterium]